MANPVEFGLRQTVDGGATSAASLIVPISNTLPGSLLVMFEVHVGAGSPNSITDTAGNTWGNSGVSATFSGGGIQISLAYNTTSTNQVNIGWSASGSNRSVFIREYTGIVRYGNGMFNRNDTSIQNNGLTVNGSVSTGNTTTRFPNVLCISACGWTGTAGSLTLTKGSESGNFVSNAPDTTHILGVQDYVTTATGSQSASFNGTNGSGNPNWAAGVCCIPMTEVAPLRIEALGLSVTSDPF